MVRYIDALQDYLNQLYRYHRPPWSIFWSLSNPVRLTTFMADYANTLSLSSHLRMSNLDRRPGCSGLVTIPASRTSSKHIYLDTRVRRRKKMTLGGMLLLRLRIATMLSCSFRTIYRSRVHTLVDCPHPVTIQYNAEWSVGLPSSCIQKVFS